LSAPLGFDVNGIDQGFLSTNLPRCPMRRDTRAFLSEPIDGRSRAPALSLSLTDPASGA
jgi:hypothetical protein